MGQIMIHSNFMDENQESPVDRLQFSMVFLEVWMAVVRPYGVECRR